MKLTKSSLLVIANLRAIIARLAIRLTVPPIPSTEPFPCDVAKKFQEI